MASPAPALAWSVTLCLRHRGGLEIHAAAENILPGWGHGGERLSFLLRLRRRLRLAVTSQCVRAPAATEPKPRACRILHFLRIRWARVPGVPSIWRRKKRPPERAAAAKPGSRSQNRALMRPAHRERVWMAKATTVLCVVAVLAAAAASIAVFRLTTGYHHCTPWRGFLAKRFVEFLEPPPLYKWLLKTSLKWLLNK